MLPDKVIITITAEGTNITVFSGEKELSNRSSIMISSGESRAKQSGDIYDDLDEDFAELSEAIDNIGLEIFDVACALFVIKEES
jgi:hypothetical protein